jgi:hypothetical protein
VKAIFEEVIPAIDIQKQIAARDLDEEVIDPAITMFNNYDKNAPGGYFFEQGLIYGETNTALDKESLKVLEGWCLFFHHEAYKNFLCALVHVSEMVYKTKGIIHKDVYANLSKEIERHLLTRKDAIARKLGIPFGYNVKMDNDNYVVSASNLCPNQVPLGKIATMATIYEMKGSGWGMVAKREYFWSSNPRDGDKTQLQMTTAKEFEFAHTLLSIMAKIRVLMSDKKNRKFEIQCATKEYQNTNKTLREWHPTLFQNETYTFQPNNELVMTLPFKYVNQLERGKWTPLEEKWLKKVKQTLRQAETNSIRSI